MLQPSVNKNKKRNTTALGRRRRQRQQRQQPKRPSRFGMLNAVRTKHSVYVVGSSRSRQTVALTVEVEAEEAAALSSNVHLGK